MDAIFNALKSALDSGSLFSAFGALFLSYLGGILSSFTPCIYPMIPITIGFVGGTSERNFKSGLILSSTYVLGMSLVYTILGMVAAISGQIFGTMTNTPGWYLALGGVMVFSALWMFDVIHFDPNVILHKFMKSKTSDPRAGEREATAMGAFVLGASSGFIAAPCTTPVLTTVLSYIADQKSIVMGGLLMFTFALGLGTILVIIGTSAGALKLLPKSGKWMNAVKKFSGFLILVLGEYYIFKAGTYK